MHAVHGPPKRRGRSGVRSSDRFPRAWRCRKLTSQATHFAGAFLTREARYDDYRELASYRQMRRLTDTPTRARAECRRSLRDVANAPTPRYTLSEESCQTILHTIMRCFLRFVEHRPCEHKKHWIYSLLHKMQKLNESYDLTVLQ